MSAVTLYGHLSGGPYFDDLHVGQVFDTAPAVTLREVAQRFAALVGAPEPRLRVMSNAVLRLGGLFNTEAREFRKVRYQFDRPFVIDSSAAQETFGLTPTPLDDALRSVV